MHTPLAVWRYYNGRADCETVIKELQAGFALPTLCLEQFWASEAALSHPAGKTTIKLAVPKREREWWRGLWEKILSPTPNCNAVENQPAFSG